MSIIFTILITILILYAAGGVYAITSVWRDKDYNNTIKVLIAIIVGFCFAIQVYFVCYISFGYLI